MCASRSRATCGRTSHLQPGEVSEVGGCARRKLPSSNTTSATLGGTLSNNEINDLPLNGRNYENLLQLRPGRDALPRRRFLDHKYRRPACGGQRLFYRWTFSTANHFSGQGIINGAGIAGDSATILPIDAIQEFNVQENPPAEYGWKPGCSHQCWIEVGNQYDPRRSAFAFGRDGDMLDARNYFNADPAAKTPRTLEQFGGSLGGAIVKDKAFFFGAYEGQRYDVGNSYSVSDSDDSSALPLTPGSTPTCTSAAHAGVDCSRTVFRMRSPTSLANRQFRSATPAS